MIIQENTIEILQKFSLILNLIFTVFSFKLVLSYKYFHNFANFLGKLGNYIFVSPKRIGSKGLNKTRIDIISIGKFEGKEINPNFLISFLIISIFGFSFFSNEFLSILNFPLKIMKYGIIIWEGNLFYWKYIVFPFLSFFLFLIGLGLLTYFWGFVIIGNIKAISHIFDLLNRHITKTKFEILTFLLFIISWSITFYLSGL